MDGDLYLTCRHECATAGTKGLVTRAGSKDNSSLLEIWGSGRLLKQLVVPKVLHGSIYDDGWFASGADWNHDESQVAYVAEVGGWFMISGNVAEGITFLTVQRHQGEYIMMADNVPAAMHEQGVDHCLQADALCLMPFGYAICQIIAA